MVSVLHNASRLMQCVDPIRVSGRVLEVTGLTVIAEGLPERGEDSGKGVLIPRPTHEVVVFAPHKKTVSQSKGIATLISYRGHPTHQHFAHFLGRKNLDVSRITIKKCFFVATKYGMAMCVDQPGSKVSTLSVDHLVVIVAGVRRIN